MVRGADGVELILGIKKDPVFGTVVLAGMGGTNAELFADRSLGFPPLNERLARRMLESLKIWPLLNGYRGRRPARIDRLLEVLIRLSYFAADYPEVAELDINPLLVTPERVIALDARLVVDGALAAGRAPFAHLALRPYPEEICAHGAPARRHRRAAPAHPSRGRAAVDGAAGRLLARIHLCPLPPFFPMAVAPGGDPLLLHRLRPRDRHGGGAGAGRQARAAGRRAARRRSRSRERGIRRPGGGQVAEQGAGERPDRMLPGDRRPLGAEARRRPDRQRQRAHAGPFPAPGIRDDALGRRLGDRGGEGADPGPTAVLSGG